MEPLEMLLSVALVWGLAVITPGPNLLITIQTAMAHSALRSSAVVLGIVAGTLLWALAGFLGITVLFLTLPWLHVPLKIVGGLYLIYLGIKLIRNAKVQDIESMEIKDQKRTVLESFKLGVLTNLSNPKTALFISSLFAVTIPSHISSSLGFACIILMGTLSLGWYGLMAWLFSQQAFKQVYLRFKHWLERLSGTIFILFGGTLAVSE